MSGIVHLLPNGQQQFCDNNGDPLAGGFVYHYVPGTSTPSTTWVDQGLTTPNTNPIRLDAGGRATIWGNTSYRQLLTDSLGTTIWDQITGDGALSNLVLVNPTITGGTISGAAISGGTITASVGSSIVTAAGPNPNPIPSNSPQGPRTVAQFVGSFVDARNFLGNGGAALRATSDDSSIIQAAINYAQSIGGATVYLGPGPLKFPAGSSINWPNGAIGVNLKGDGPLTTVITITGNLTGDVLIVSAGGPQSCQIRDLGFNCIGTGSSGSLIHFIDSSFALVDNVLMTGGFSAGVSIDGNGPTDIIDLTCIAPLSTSACVWLGPLSPIDKVNIDSCNFTGAQNGILITQGQAASIVNSQITGCSQNGIGIAPQASQLATSISITGVVIDHCSASGIDVGATAAGATNVVSIGNCVIRNCEFGVATIANSPGTVAEVSITGCHILSSSQHGIVNDASGFVTVSSNVLVGNGTSATNTFSGISINNAINCAIVGNSTSSASSGPVQAYGISLIGTSDYCTVVGNTTSAGGSGSINNTASGTHNVVASNTGT